MLPEGQIQDTTKKISFTILSLTLKAYWVVLVAYQSQNRIPFSV